MLNLKGDRFLITQVEEIIVTEGKVSHLSEEYAADIKWSFQSYPNVIQHYFDVIRPSWCESRTSLNSNRKNRFHKSYDGYPQLTIRPPTKKLKVCCEQGLLFQLNLLGTKKDLHRFL